MKRISVVHTTNEIVEPSPLKAIADIQSEFKCSYEHAEEMFEDEMLGEIIMPSKDYSLFWE